MDRASNCRSKVRLVFSPESPAARRHDPIRLSTRKLQQDSSGGPDHLLRLWRGSGFGDGIVLFSEQRIDDGQVAK